MSNRVIVQPRTYEALGRGIDVLVKAIRPTLGPLPRLVAIEQTSRRKAPELLDNGAIIARRITELPQHDVNMGAMFLRHVLWHLHERYGDGTATGAVLLQAVYQQAVRYIAAGGNAMVLRYHLETAARDVFLELTQMAFKLEGAERLARVAETVCADRELASMLGEIFDIIGPYGFVDIRSGHSRKMEREYTEGVYWQSGVFSPHMLTDRRTQRVELENAAILITDLNFDQPSELLPALKAAAAAGYRQLVIIAAGLSSTALSLLLANQNPNRLQCVGVKLPSAHPMGQDAALEDLAILTGGRPFRKIFAEEVRAIRDNDFGRARRVWATPVYMGMTGGQGNPHGLRQHIAYLRKQHTEASGLAERKQLQERLGKLLGGSATLWVGGPTPAAIEVRKQLAERTAEAMRGVMHHGVVAGGGSALLACRPALQLHADECDDLDAKAAYRIVLQALEEPFRTIVSNAGYEPHTMMARLKKPTDGMNVMTGKIVDMCEEGILDSAAVVMSVAYTAVTSAALALTVDVLVHGRQPELKFAP